MNTPIQRGVYRHYKGKEYLVLDEALHSETRELIVVYRELSGQYQLHVRPKAMFFEEVGVGGRRVPRFELVQPIG